MKLPLDAYRTHENVAAAVGAWGLLEPALGIDRSNNKTLNNGSTAEGAAGSQEGGDENDAWPRRSARAFVPNVFAMPHCNCDGSAVRCLARSEVQVIQILLEIHVGFVL